MYLNRMVAFAPSQLRSIVEHQEPVPRFLARYFNSSEDMRLEKYVC